MSNKPLEWIPSLYLGEALPFTAVMIVSVIMFKEFGLSDEQITLYTGWMGLPWVIKPIWSPIIDNIKTKRWWILSMQFLMGITLALVAFTIPTSFWLQGTLAIFMIIAFASATHDISADGFYSWRDLRYFLFDHRTQGQRTGTVRRTSQHVLPHRHDYRSGRIGYACRMASE